ncbi:MAG: hypothetical protein J0L61_04640, partial [Planctomycetes bacterium]|nr:hypothetical protein [Planctomycetota bacterium]
MPERARHLRPFPPVVRELVGVRLAQKPVLHQRRDEDAEERAVVSSLKSKSPAAMRPETSTTELSGPEIEREIAQPMAVNSA